MTAFLCSKRRFTVVVDIATQRVCELKVLSDWTHNAIVVFHCHLVLRIADCIAQPLGQARSRREMGSLTSLADPDLESFPLTAFADVTEAPVVC